MANIKKQPDMSINVRGIGEKAETNSGGLVPNGKNKALVNSNKVTRQIAFNMEVMNLSETAKDSNDIGVLRSVFKAYLELCNQYSIVPNNMSAYASIGISLNTAKMWAAGKAGAEKKEFISWANTFLSMSTQTGILTGTISPSVGMFLQKNFDGLSDNPTQVAEETDLLGEKPSADDIIDRYSDLPDEE